MPVFRVRDLTGFRENRFPVSVGSREECLSWIGGKASNPPPYWEMKCDELIQLSCCGFSQRDTASAPCESAPRCLNIAALIQSIHVMMESHNFSGTHVCTVLRCFLLQAHSKSTSKGTVKLPALVMASVIRPVTAPPSESGASTHKASWIIMTIRASMFRRRNIRSSRNIAVLIKSASIICGRDTRNCLCTAGFALVANLLILPVGLVTTPSVGLTALSDTDYRLRKLSSKRSLSGI